MFEKVNPYNKTEIGQEAAAQKCGCMCVSNSKTVGNMINLGIAGSTCAATCKTSSSANKNANFNQAKNNKKY